MSNGSIIIIGGGSLQVPLIRTAKDTLNLHTIVFDQNPEAPGALIADQFSQVSTIDTDAAAQRAVEIQHNLSNSEKIRGVITAGTDVSFTVAKTAEALDLPGIFPESALAASDKLVMRNTMKSAGVPVPVFSEIHDIQNAKETYRKFRSETGKSRFVIKPTRNMGARGVRLIRSESEIEEAFRYTKQFSARGTILLEEYMEGPELSADCLLWTVIPWKEFINLTNKKYFLEDPEYRRSIFDKYVKIQMTGLADRIIRHPPFFIEPGHNMPSLLSGEIYKESLQVMRDSAVALGIFSGAAKGDLKVTSEGVKVGEVAARLSGGYMSSHTYPLHSGINLHKNALLISLGEQPEDLAPQKNQTVIERAIPFTLNQDNPGLFQTGLITEISADIGEILKIPGVEHIEFTKKKGDILHWPESNVDKAGHIIASGSNLEEAEAAAQAAYEKIIFRTDNSYTFTWKEIEERAKKLLPSDVCHVCRNCDGKHCASGVPGMGAAGRMNSFKNNSYALTKVRVIPQLIKKSDPPNSENFTEEKFFGIPLRTPVMAAPLTGVKTNMGGFTGEKEFAEAVMRGAVESGSVMWFGDGADPERYKLYTDLIAKSEGRAVITIKPRCDLAEIEMRIKAALERGVLAVAFDIDSVGLRTNELKNQSVCLKSAEEWKRIRDLIRVPMIIKGILSVQDAEAAVEAGADAIIISNHGGRILDDLPGSAEVLPSIVSVVGNKIKIYADGGIRSGSDVYKMMCLGASGVLIGRPLVTAAAGAGYIGVKRLFADLNEDFRKYLHLCGRPDISRIIQN